MSFPKQSEIELPLLKTLQELGEKAEPVGRSHYDRDGIFVGPDACLARIRSAIYLRTAEVAVRRDHREKSESG